MTIFITNNKTSLRTLILILLFFCANVTYGGGIAIDATSLRFNGYPCGTNFPTNVTLSMSYKAEDYSYSGSRSESAYIAFALLPINKYEKPIYILQLSRSYKQAEDFKFYYNVIFRSPITRGKYKLVYNRVKLFSPSVIGRIENNSVNLSNFDAIEVKAHFEHYKGLTQELCELNFMNKSVNEEQLEVYLKVNKELPYLYKVKSGLSKKPLSISWSIRNALDCEDILFRYKLDPDDVEWSPWQEEKEVSYYFLNRGPHQFKLMCKYKFRGRVMQTPEVLYSFNLDNSFFSQPSNEVFTSGGEISYIDKAGVRKKSKKPKEVISNTYERSTALLIGVATNRNKTVPELVYINQDINSMEFALKSVGFNVINLNKSKDPSNRNIIEAIRSVISQSNRNDRLIIYISSHGFMDNLSKKPYLVCSDCNPNSPTSCIPILEIKNLLDQTKDHYKHVLLIIDSCFSGLGIIDKSSSHTEIKSIASKAGSHIMTAGLGDQLAKMDHKLKRSVFTKYLSDGLVTKTADYTKDGIITLTELLVYVQYNVAIFTGSSQTPMMGRLNGVGEMIFD